MSGSHSADSSRIDPLQDCHKSFVIDREAFAGLRSHATQKGAHLIERHDQWAHPQNVRQVLAFTNPIQIEGIDSGALTPNGTKNNLLESLATPKEMIEEFIQSSFFEQLGFPAKCTKKGSKRLADCAAHVTSRSDIDCDLGASTIGISVILEALQAGNGSYVGPAARECAAIRSALIAGTGIGWGRANLRDDESGALFSETHFFSNHGASSGSLAGFKVFRNGHSSQDANDGHHDH